jgi:hypothetical protein
MGGSGVGRAATSWAATSGSTVGGGEDAHIDEHHLAAFGEESVMDEGVLEPLGIEPADDDGRLAMSER